MTGQPDKSDIAGEGSSRRWYDNTTFFLMDDNRDDIINFYYTAEGAICIWR